MVLDKMVRTKWYNFILCIHFNSVEFNIYLVGPNPNSQIHVNDKHIEVAKGVKVEAGLIKKNHIVKTSVID